MRLNKAIADRGYCSRRKADILIKAGKVKVNDKIETNPATQITNEDCISIDGNACKGIQELKYIILNKPIEYVSTAHDPENRTTVLDLLPTAYKEFRLYPVGRLDYYSEGLIFLTNDGKITNFLLHPKHNIPRVYEVTVRGKITQEMIKALEAGLVLEQSIKLAPIKVEIIKQTDSKTIAKFTLSQGINREIRRICEQFNLVVLHLRRIAHGLIKLGNLKPGAFRELNNKEITALYNEFRKKTNL